MTTHEGFENYQTWAVSLWLNNDEGTWRYWNGAALEILNSLDSEKPSPAEIEKTVEELAESLKEHFEENTPTLPGPWCDLMTHSLAYVNWEEVAEGFVASAIDSL